MNSSRTSLLPVSLVFIAGFALAPAARAAVDAFIWFEDGTIKGESRDAAHRDWIEAVSTDFVANSPRDVATGQASGRRQFKPFHIVKLQDTSSPALAEAFSGGRVFPKVTIELRGSRWLLTDVKVTGIQKQSAAGGEGPKETLTLNYGSIKWAYSSQTGSGSPQATPSKALLSAAVAPGSLTAAQAPRITGVSASAPFLGTGVTVTITSTGPCTNAIVGYGDGSTNQNHDLTGPSTQISAHVYSSPGLKTIQVGGHDAPYWAGQQAHHPLSRGNDCTGWAETTVTLRSDTAPAPVQKR